MRANVYRRLDGSGVGWLDVHVMVSRHKCDGLLGIDRMYIVHHHGDRDTQNAFSS